jgi:predicted nucleic acid-binding protein
VGAAKVWQVTQSRGVVLDTCAIIDLHVLNLGALVDRQAAVSAITVAELAYGLNVDDPAQRAARTDRFYGVLNTLRVLPFDTAAGKMYGVLAAVVRKAGRDSRPRRLDLQIAATAASNKLPLVTRNPDDFVGLDSLVTVLPV